MTFINSGHLRECKKVPNFKLSKTNTLLLMQLGYISVTVLRFKTTKFSVTSLSLMLADITFILSL